MKRTGTRTLAFSYARFSTDPQQWGDSLRRQSQLFHDWLKRNPDVIFDDTLSLIDRGVSAFNADNWDDADTALSRFLALVGTPRVPVGSYLVVENLDRLSRQNPVRSLPRILELISKGIRVVQLFPFERVYSAEMDPSELVSMLSEISRGYSESKSKSVRVTSAWAAKKAAAREGKPHGKACPAWLELRDGRYEFKPGAKETGRLIFEMCIRGLGTFAITQHLNANAVPHFLPGRAWQRGYVCHILKQVSATGVYQPRRGRALRIPDGDPIPGYFPALVTEQEFHAAQDARKRREGKPGRKPVKADVATPFSGLLWDALAGVRIQHKSYNGKPYLMAGNHLETGCERETPWFRADVFSDALLSGLSEIGAADVFRDPEGFKIADLSARQADVDAQLLVALERFKKNPQSQVWANQIDALEAEAQKLADELSEARMRAMSPLSEAWQTAVEAIKRADRQKLRTAILATVDDIYCVFVRSGSWFVGAVQVRFRGGEATRDFLLKYRPFLGCKAGGKEIPWQGKTLSGVVKLKADFRDVEQARAIREALLKADPVSL